MDVSKEDALLLDLTSYMEDINSKEELSRGYNENNLNISFLKNYLLPKRKGNKGLFEDLELLISQNVLRNNEQEKQKVLIKNQRESTSLFLIYAIM